MSNQHFSQITSVWHVFNKEKFFVSPARNGNFNLVHSYKPPLASDHTLCLLIFTGLTKGIGGSSWLTNRVITWRWVFQFVFGLRLESSIWSINKLFFPLHNTWLFIYIGDHNFWHFSLIVFILDFFIGNSRGHSSFHIALVSRRIRVGSPLLDNLRHLREFWLYIVVKLKCGSISLVTSDKVPQSNFWSYLFLLILII